METSKMFNNYIDFERAEPLNTTGGTSLTYKVRTNGHLYFMKQLRPEYATDARYKEMFVKEFESGTAINHPHVVKYESMGENENGPYIIMEFINGYNLKEKLESEPHFFEKPKNLYKIVRQILEALQAMHKKNIIYLDLSPKNIMLTKTTNDVKLIDLGYCITDWNDHTAGSTKFFTAPECAAEGVHDIDARADIYAFGCLLNYIEKKGIELPKKLRKIKERCLQPQKEKRYYAIDDIINAINFNNLHSLLRIAAIVAAIVFVGTGFTYTTAWESICDYIAWERGLVPEKFEEGGVFYRVTDRDARIAEITYKGSYHYEFENEYHGIVTLPCEVTHRGRTFKITTIAQDALNLNTCKYIVIENGIKYIGDNALSRGYSDSTLYIPQSVEHIGKGALANNIYLKGITVDANNPNYDSREGCNAIIEKATNTLIAGCHKSKIPQGITKIGDYAFAGHFLLGSIDIPESVTFIGDYAFHACPFYRIALPQELTHIGNYAFQWCEKLVEIKIPVNVEYIGEAALSNCGYHTLVIPDKVTHIGNWAFDKCRNLATVTIGKNVASIGSFAFDGCNKLTKITSRIPGDKLFAVEGSTFGSIASKCTLYVPRGAKAAYSNTNGWNIFSKIVEVDM
ncbi:MAG: leucine-rich repeat protein [Bacteroidaceae bacterium]|nr:leucine-rich repeat protein [Bacteroidaceae bacterium]